MPREGQKKLNESRARRLVKNMAVSAVVILFFVAILLIYYNMLYSEKRENIIKSGQKTAMESSEQFNNYLVTTKNTVELTAYSIELMMKEGRTDEDILFFLVEQTNAVMGSIFADTTGLYAYVNGKYLDGTMWDPGPDFVAEERPWYIGAHAAGAGKLTMIEPYVDAQTGNVTMTIVKLLNDGKTIVAMDVILDRVQAIAEAAAGSDDCDYQIILDGHNIVVAHSDKSEVGKDYSKEKDNLWAEITASRRQGDKEYMEVSSGGEQYIVYSVDLQNDWLCLSVKNASTVFEPLRMLLVLTLSVVIVAVFVLLGVLNQSNKRYRIAERFNKQLSSTAEIYLAAYEVDLSNDTYSRILNEDSKITDILYNAREYAQRDINEYVKKTADPSCLDDMLKFVDYSTINERMGGNRTIIQEFLNRHNRWIRARFVASQYTPEGNISTLLWLMEDVDEEKKTREQLADLSLRAFAASEAKSAFLSNMSHEIRTPINAVLGMNEMILRESNDESVLTYSQNIKTAGNTLLGLVNDILDFSKIEAGKMEINSVDYDLSSVINDLVNMVETRADDKGIKLVLNIDSRTPKLLRGDDVRLKQVITNLLTNAVKYTEQGSVTFTLGFNRIEEEPDNVMLNVAVKDTGIGIKHEDIDKLYMEFERIEEDRNRSVEGTGLGLTITRSLLWMMGSNLTVESDYGSGSEFGFSLKQGVVEWEPLGDYQSSFRMSQADIKQYKERFTAPTASVLVVDDNPMNLMVFKSLLKRTKMTIDTAMSGDEGLSLAGRCLYDILFLDHMMPEKDGIETLHELRSSEDSLNLNTPTICLTANAISGARDKYLAEGFDDYLTKPINPEKLEEMLIRYIREDKVIMTSEDEDPNETYDDIFAEFEEDIPEKLRPLSDSGLADVRAGINNSGGLDDYMPLLKIFHEAMDEESKRIDDFYEEGDIENYTIKVHALKSSAKIIGAKKFAEMAQALESAGKNGDKAFIKEHHSTFMLEYMKFKEPLSLIFRKEVDDEDKEVADAEALSAALDEIREAAEDMDCDRLEEIFERMDRFRIPDEEAALWKRLKEASGNFDYDGITAIINERG